MSFVDAELSPQRKNGQIKIHGPEAFAGMRAAGRLAAQALDLMVDAVKPGVTTEALDKILFDFAMDNNAYPATQILKPAGETMLFVHDSFVLL